MSGSVSFWELVRVFDMFSHHTNAAIHMTMNKAIYFQMLIAAMVIRNIQLSKSDHILHKCVLNGRHSAAIHLKIGQYSAEIFQNQEKNYQHV